MATVLVVGGSGFVGSAIVGSLASDGHEVVVPHRTDGVPVRLRQVPPNVRLTPRIAVQDREALARLVHDAQPSTVVYAAAGGVQADTDDPETVLGVNVAGVANALGAAAGAGVNRFILLGSGFEYSSSGEPLSEHSPVRPATFYGATKAAASIIASFYRDSSALDVTVVRLFSVYGPAESTRRFVPYLVTRSLDGLPIEMSHGHQIRDYIYVQDAAEAIRRLVRFPKRAPSVVNLAGLARQSLREIAERVICLCGSESPLMLGSRVPNAGDRPVFLGDSGRLRAALGWDPSTDMDAGLRATIAWYSANRFLWSAL